MAVGLQHLLLALLRYLKTILFTLLTGITIPSKPSPTTIPPSPINHDETTSQKPAVDQEALLSRIASLADTNEAAAHLHAMITHDGAGTWPPRFPSAIATWPAPLRAYHEVYLACAPHLSTAAPSTSDAANAARRAAFRARMTALLAARVDVAAVRALLAASTHQRGSAVPQDVLNALLACVAVSRHAFRWATIPAVRVAQREKRVAYPPALALPWPFLQARYGFGGGAGNVTTNFLCHWGGDAVGPVYRVNAGRAPPPAAARAEYWFAYMFAETERLALPVYAEVVEALGAWERGDRAAVLAALERMRKAVRLVVKVLYDNLVESKVDREVWLGWVQGFHAYGAGEVVGADGRVVESDGVSANQLPFFHVVDAFLGMGTYLAPEDMRSGVPVAQRRFSAEVRKRSFRREVKERGDEEVEREMAAIARQVRVWRAAHRVRIVPYLEQPAPERLLMTAGKSVLETKDVGIASVKGFIDYLDDLVRSRMEQTV